MNFGQAIEALKQGKRVARTGWNGKGMWLALTKGSKIHAASARGGSAKLKAAVDPDDTINIAAHIDMRAADGTLVVGWLASQTDMLAEDWMVVE